MQEQSESKASGFFPARGPVQEAHAYTGLTAPTLACLTVIRALNLSQYIQFNDSASTVSGQP